VNLAFLASHSGSNLQAVLDACREGRLHARPCVVISNNSQAKALQRARQADVPFYHLSTKTHPEPDVLDQAILQTLERHQTNLIILAGYMRKLGAKTLAYYKGRIINIHPALLPKYGGHGMYGLNVHAAVLAAREAETGVTIHVVDEEYDQGRIIAQCRVPVGEQDTLEALAERVLVREHELLVNTLKQIVSGEIALPA